MRFSIGIPAFKSAFLKECINSILMQTFKEFELIIINDASPDPIDEIISIFEDSRIQYYKNEQNVGAKDVVNNWNKCLDLAKGDYFILMGDDDKLEPNYLEEFDLLIKKYPHLDIFHCRSKIINGQSEIIALTPSWPEYENIYDNIWHRIKGFRLQYISDFVYKTQALKDKKGFYYLPLAWGSDDITAYSQIGNKGIAHTNNCLLNYRNSPITISNSGNIDLKLLAIEGERKWFDEFLSSSKPMGIDKVVFSQIKILLPNYFKNKRKATLSMEYKKHFFRGILMSFSEIKNKRMTYKEFFSVTLFALKLYS
jgi:glycosyltransferase involved in cell wall biosynthesis